MLDRGLLSLGLVPGPAAREAIDGHVRLLLAWTDAINLTAIRDPVEVARRHVLDSLAAIPVLRRLGADTLLDLGSGGGFPGLPLAILLPASRVLLVESIGKKARFLETAVSALGLDGRVAVAAERAEALARQPAHREAWAIVTARAVAPLAVLVELGLPLVSPGGALVAWKREPLEAELAAAGAVVRAAGGTSPEVHPVDVPGLMDHRLVVVRKAYRAQRATGTPRRRRPR